MMSETSSATAAPFRKRDTAVPLPALLPQPLNPRHNAVRRNAQH